MYTPHFTQVTDLQHTASSWLEISLFFTTIFMINLYHFFCKNVLGMCTLMSQFCKHVSRYLLKSTTNNIAIWTNFQTVCLLLQFLLLLYFTRRSSVINLINCKTLWLNLLVFYFKVASQVTTPVSSSIVSHVHYKRRNNNY